MKGAGYMLDATAAILVLLVFVGANFSSSSDVDWTGFQDRIEARDMLTTLRKTGVSDSLVSRGGTGSLKTAVESISSTEVSVSGQISENPPNMDVGVYTPPEKIRTANLTRVSSDRCSGDLDEIRNESLAPLLRTVDGPDSKESERGNIRLYLGNYDDGETFASQLDYDAVWVDNGTECDFERVENPVRIDEIFYWGNRTGDGKLYDLRQINLNSNTWNGTLVLADGKKMSRFQDTASMKVAGTNTNVQFNSFNYSDSLEEFDVLMMENMSSIERMQSTGNRDRIESFIQKKPAMFLMNVSKNNVSAGSFLNDMGFEWVDLDYSKTSDANCNLKNPKTIQNSCNVEVDFGDREKNIEKYSKDLRTDLDDVSIHPEGSLKSSEEDISKSPVELSNYIYGHINQSPENKTMRDDNSITGNPDSACNNVTVGEFEFPDKNGGSTTFRVSSTRLGNTASICNENTRALNIDLNGNGNFGDSGEGPFFEGDLIRVEDIEYRIQIPGSGEPGCEGYDCARFRNLETPNVELMNFVDSRGVIRTGYSESYSSADRKLLVSAMYSLRDKSEIPGIGDGIKKSSVGVNSGNIYEISLRWNE